MSEPEDEAAVDREDAESLRKVEGGGLPLGAERRLSDLREGGRGAFTSDLSVNGFALCHRLGLTPLSQVMGSAIYQIGYQGLSWPMMMGGSSVTEMGVLSQAWNEVRRLAFNRLELEARTLGAHAVVGVQVKVSQLDWAEGAIEYVVMGTAVRRADGPGDQVAMTDLSVADYAKLLAAGIEPAGIVAATSVFFATYEMGMLGGGMLANAVNTPYNYEVREFTQAFYSARETVMARLGQQAQQLGATGVVGVRISHSAHRQDVGGGPGFGGAGGGTSNGLVATFDAIGTAIRDTTPQRPQAPKPAIDLSI